MINQNYVFNNLFLCYKFFLADFYLLWYNTLHFEFII